ncbi:MAG: serine hydrolase, partial [Thermodesulfobacteriota bacterium]
MKIRCKKSLLVFALITLFLLVPFGYEAVSKTVKKSPQAKFPRTELSQKKVQSSSKETAPQSSSQGSLQCDAQSAVLMDGLTGQVLYEQNPNVRIAPASFVKVMTLYVIGDAIRAGQIKTDDLVTVSETAWRRGWKTEGSKMFIKVGER